MCRSMEKQTVTVVPLSHRRHNDDNSQSQTTSKNQPRDQETDAHWQSSGYWSDAGMPPWDSRDCKCHKRGGKHDKADKRDRKCRKHEGRHEGRHGHGCPCCRPDVPPAPMPGFMSPGGPFMRPIHPPYMPGAPPCTRGRGMGSMFRGRGGHFARGHPYLYGTHFFEGTGSRVSRENRKASFCVDLNHFEASEISVTIEGKTLKIHGLHERRADETGTPSREVKVEYDVTGRDTDGVRGVLGDDGYLEIHFRGAAAAEDAASDDDDVVEVPAPGGADGVGEDGDFMADDDQ